MWIVFAFISALFSALAAVFEKKALFKSNPIVFSLILSAFTLVLAAPLLFFAEFGLISLNALMVLYLKSVLGACAFLLVMYGIKHNELSNSLPLLVITPALVALLAYVFLNESIGVWGIGGMLLLLSGTYVLQLPKGGNWLSPFLFVQRNKAQWYIIGAILLFSTTAVLDKSILKSYRLPAEAFIPIQQVFFTFNFLVLFLLKKLSVKELSTTLKSHGRLVLLIAVFAVIYRYSHILAVKAGSVALVLSIKRTSVFFATIIGGSYFREQELVKRVIAVAVMVAGTVLVLLS